METTAKAKQQAEEICLGQETHEIYIVLVWYVEIWALLFKRVFFGQEKRNTVLVCMCSTEEEQWWCFAGDTVGDLLT